MRTTKWLPVVVALSLAPALAFAQDNTADPTKSTDTAAAQMNQPTDATGTATTQTETTKTDATGDGQQMKNDLHDTANAAGDKAADKMDAEASKLTGSAHTLWQIHDVNKDEIAAGNLALTNSDSAAVKSYGQKLIDDHTAAEAKVMTRAKKLGVDLDAKPTGADKADEEKDQSMMDQMKAAKGADFDKQFLQMMVAGHKQAIELVTAARGDSAQRNIRPLLDELLPKLRQHEKTAMRLEGHHAGMQPQGRRPDKE